MACNDNNSNNSSSSSKHMVLMRYRNPNHQPPPSPLYLRKPQQKPKTDKRRRPCFTRSYLLPLLPEPEELRAPPPTRTLTLIGGRCRGVLGRPSPPLDTVPVRALTRSPSPRPARGAPASGTNDLPQSDVFICTLICIGAF